MRHEARNEAHICFHDSGHQNSVDCWCEPSRIYWFTNVHGVTILVVEHVDDARIHRLVRTAARERDKDIEYAPNVSWGIDEPWISRALDRVKIDTPPDPNERSL